MWSKMNVRDWCNSRVLMKSKLLVNDYNDTSDWYVRKFENGDVYEHYETDIDGKWYNGTRIVTKINGKKVEDYITKRH